MSLAEFHHGVRVQEVSDGTTNLQIISTSIIGLVGTAPNATADLPLDKPTLFTSTRKALAAIGDSGTLKGAVEAIASQSAPVIVIVRVAEGEGDDDEERADQTSKVIGTVTGNTYTGIQALRAAQAQLGVKPKILGAPGLDTKPVTDALVSVAQALRGFVYASAWGATDVSSALAYRNQFGARELMIIWPDFKHWSVSENASIKAPTVAYAMGLRAKIDQTLGWHKTLSNVPVNGPDGITHDVFFDLQSNNTDAGLLNADHVTTLINHAGYRFWGNRTCSKEQNFIFESATRTAQVLAETVAEGHFAFVDKPMHPSLVRDIIEGINARFRSLKAGGYILDGKAWYDEEINTTESLKSGKLIIDYDYTPIPPLEDLGFQQRITDRYFGDFATRVATGA